MNDHYPEKKKLSLQQVQVAILIASGYSALAAAKKEKLTNPTAVYKWLKTDVFKKRVDECRELIEEEIDENFEKERTRLAIAAQDSISFMANLVNDEAASNKDRLAASKDILNRLGIDAPKKHELTGKDGAPIQVLSATYDEAMAIVERQSKGIIEARDQQLLDGEEKSPWED